MTAEAIAQTLSEVAQRIDSVAAAQRTGRARLPGSVAALETISAGLRSSARDWADLAPSQPRAISANIQALRQLFELLTFLEKQFGSASEEIGQAAAMLARLIDTIDPGESTQA